MSVRDQVIGIVAKHTSVDASQITDQSTLDDLSIESLDLVEIIFEIEETFDIEIPLNANEGGAVGADLGSIGDVVKVVQTFIDKNVTAE